MDKFDVEIHFNFGCLKFEIPMRHLSKIRKKQLSHRVKNSEVSVELEIKICESVIYREFLKLKR